DIDLGRGDDSLLESARRMGNRGVPDQPYLQAVAADVEERRRRRRSGVDDGVRVSHRQAMRGGGDIAVIVDDIFEAERRGVIVLVANPEQHSRASDSSRRGNAPPGGGRRAHSDSELVAIFPRRQRLAPVPLLVGRSRVTTILNGSNPW